MGRLKKLALAVGIGLVALCAIIASIPRGPVAPIRAGVSGSVSTSSPPSATASPLMVSTTTPTEVSATATSSATATATPTMAAPTNTPKPSSTKTPEERYIAIAQGSALPNIRKGMDIPEGEWKATASNLGDGPELEIRVPLNPANSSEQFVRLGKQNITQIINALFVADPELFRITAIGTFPDLGQELPAVSIFVYRSKSDHWGTVTRDELESIAEWVNVKPRFR